jgi:5'-nucleotidase
MSQKKLRILISNDDGVHAEGIRALAKEFGRDHSVVIVAPETEKSTTGHHLTLHKPLRLHRLEKDVYSVSGGPADCIHIGLNVVFKGRKPDLILSGINRGANLGQDVFYSGTASAAREGANQGIPSVGVSLSLDFHKRGKQVHFQSAARSLRQVLGRVLPHFAGKADASWKAGLKRWPSGMMLNVNVPNLAMNKLKGVAAATQGYRVYSTNIIRRVDSRERDYFWIGGTYQGYRDIKESDCWYVDRGYVSVTPLELDTTMSSVYENLRNVWKLRK